MGIDARRGAPSEGPVVVSGRRSRLRTARPAQVHGTRGPRARRLTGLEHVADGAGGSDQVVVLHGQLEDDATAGGIAHLEGVSRERGPVAEGVVLLGEAGEGRGAVGAGSIGKARPPLEGVLGQADSPGRRISSAAGFRSK